ncbi:hypothetical protein B0H13DRAFT_2361124 [Mycena leptocephala]|nr:hypothetical protein B0H13DRAFT_2361124 [Mycena leptocephala]
MRKRPDISRIQPAPGNHAISPVANPPLRTVLNGRSTSRALSVRPILVSVIVYTHRRAGTNHSPPLIRARAHRLRVRRALRSQIQAYGRRLLRLLPACEAWRD